jgi:hypothetical protein
MPSTEATVKEVKFAGDGLDLEYRMPSDAKNKLLTESAVEPTQKASDIAGSKKRLRRAILSSFRQDDLVHVNAPNCVAPQANPQTEHHRHLFPYCRSRRLLFERQGLRAGRQTIRSGRILQQ